MESSTETPDKPRSEFGASFSNLPPMMGIMEQPQLHQPRHLIPLNYRQPIVIIHSPSNGSGDGRGLRTAGNSVYRQKNQFNPLNITED